MRIFLGLKLGDNADNDGEEARGGGDRSLAIDIGDLRTRVTYRVTMLVCNMLAFVDTNELHFSKRTLDYDTSHNFKSTKACCWPEFPPCTHHHALGRRTWRVSNKCVHTCGDLYPALGKRSEKTGSKNCICDLPPSISATGLLVPVTAWETGLAATLEKLLYKICICFLF